MVSVRSCLSLKNIVSHNLLQMFIHQAPYTPLNPLAFFYLYIFIFIAHIRLDLFSLFLIDFRTHALLLQFIADVLIVNGPAAKG